MLGRPYQAGFSNDETDPSETNDVSVGCAGVAPAGRFTGAAGAAELPQVDLTDWTPPSIPARSETIRSATVKYGRALMVDTANQIGPAAADPAKRFAGNNLTCQHCHLNAGTQPYSMPLTGVWGQFPQYRGREGEVGTLEERINGCMERSMNGRVLPLDGPEMKAYLAYMKRLSTGTPNSQAHRPRPRQGWPRPACRDQNDTGSRSTTMAPDDRVLNAAAFLRRNMPLGTAFDAPVLTDADATSPAHQQQSAR
jgi:thiosulfate dehydrogenase